MSMRFIELVNQDDIHCLTDLQTQYNRVSRYMLWQRKITNQDVDINDVILDEVLEQIEKEKQK